jgi:nitroreductase
MASDPSSDFWDVVSTTRTIRRFTTEPVSDAILARCLKAATWAPSGANAQGWRR